MSNFEKTKLYNNDYTYIYSTSILSPNGNDVVGGIAIIFDSNPQFKAILKDILPTNNDDSFALFANKEKFIISTTNENFSIGSIVPIKKIFLK